MLDGLSVLLTGYGVMSKSGLHYYDWWDDSDRLHAASVRLALAVISLALAYCLGVYHRNDEVASRAHGL